MPSDLTDKCCLCQKIFDQANFPRLMPSCDHSICTNCLKNTFKNNTNIILCSFCGNQQHIIEADLQYFPKNISLIKQLKDSTTKKPSSTSQFNTPTKAVRNSLPAQSNASIPSNKKTDSFNASDFVPSDSSLISQKSYTTYQTDKKQLCSTHQKQMQIICLTDFTKLCPLCAVFGTHKEHQLKTIDQTSQLLTQTLKQFEQTKLKKKALDTKIKNNDFKKKIVDKIADVKTGLQKQIKDKFASIKQAVITAQKNAMDDINKRMKEVNDQINKIVKQESQFQTFFINWTRTIQLELAQTMRIGISFEQKAKIYLNGPIKTMKQGQFYLTQIQSYTQEKKNKLQFIPNQVIIQSGQNLIRDIYNYLNIKFDQCIVLPFNEVLLTSSRTDKPAQMTQNKGIIQQNYMTTSYNSNSQQGSANKLNSTNSIQSNNQINTMSKKPIKVQFSSSQNFLSPNRDKILSPNQGNMNGIPPKRSPRQKSKSLPKPQLNSGNNLIKSRLSPQQKQIPQPPSTIQMTQQRKKYLSNTTDNIVQFFVNDDKLDTLDLCSFDMPDHQMIQLLDYVNNKKKIKCLKLSQNKMTNDGFSQILQFLRYTTNLNLSSNLLTQDVLNALMKQKQKVPNLRILNLAHNKVNQRKAKVYVDELKKQGIIVTL